MRVTGSFFYFISRYNLYSTWRRHSITAGSATAVYVGRYLSLAAVSYSDAGMLSPLLYCALNLIQ